MRDRGWQRKAALKRIAKPLQHACRFCGAAIGEPCRSKNGRELLSLGMLHNMRITPDKKLTKSYRTWDDNAGTGQST
jgi:hypothetical protein